MNIGMLWFDNDPKSALDAKIERAASYYRNKYGKLPNLCYVHPSMLPIGAPAPAATEAASTPNERASLQHAGLEVRSTRSVLPNHFWLGINAE